MTGARSWQRAVPVALVLGWALHPAEWAGEPIVRVGSAPLYVRGDDVKTMGGLAAVIVTPQARGRSGAIAVALGFGAIIVALLVAVKRLRHQAGIEHADAVLAAEVDSLPQPRAR